MAPPAPPAPLPPGRLVPISGRGEFFLRDSGGSGPPVLLLHGWLFSSDLNWLASYEPLRRAGHRVLAIDHRGHGHGLRSPEPFRLVDCAGDAAAIVRELGCGPVVVVGYSMGGPVAQLMARDHRDTVAGLVLCSTATDWRDPYLRLFWRTMSGLRLGLGLFPTGYWERLLAVGGMKRGDRRAWAAAELSRGSSRDLAEAGREMSRYDARPWIAALRELPSAVVLTTRDRQVLPRKQRELARALAAVVFEVDGDHMVAGYAPERFNPVLLRALAHVSRATTGESWALAG